MNLEERGIKGRRGGQRPGYNQPCVPKKQTFHSEDYGATLRKFPEMSEMILSLIFMAALKWVSGVENRDRKKTKK